MTDPRTQHNETPSQPQQDKKTDRVQPVQQPAGEIGGTDGPEPTCFGDWQHAGRCSDF